MLRRFSAHPILLAGWPVLAVWSANRLEVTPGDVLPLLAVVLAVTAGVWIIALPLVGGWRRAAIVATVLTLAGQMVGHLPVAPGLVPVAVVLGLGLGAVTLMRLLRPSVVDGATFVLNGVGVVVLTLAVIPLVGASIPRQAPLSVSGPDVSTTSPPTRDVFYVIPDRYGRADTLEEAFGVDATAFTSRLEELGFHVAEKSIANYPKTAHSMAAAWHLTYLDELTGQVPEAGQGDWRPLYALLSDHRLGDLVTDLGYEYVHLGMWWSPTSTASSADVVMNHDRRSEFAQVYTETTIWPSLGSLLPGDRPVTARERARAHTLFQLEALERLADSPGDRPRFVLAHLALPHEPYVFEPDGSWVPAEVEARRSRADNFTRQLAYTDARLLGLVERLLARPEAQRPVIILQADEGPHPGGYLRDGREYRWPEAPDAELREKLTILTALYLPSVDVEVPDTLSPVNTFRLLLDAYHDTDLGMLEDRAYVFTDEHRLYEFHEVTDRLQR